MKLTQEDIKKYGTEDERRLLEAKMDERNEWERKNGFRESVDCCGTCKYGGYGASNSFWGWPTWPCKLMGKELHMTKSKLIHVSPLDVCRRWEESRD